MDGVRRASINSFGYGGANVHVVMDDALHYLESKGLKGKHNTRCLPSRSPEKRALNNGIGKANIIQSRLLVFSASDESSLKSLIKEYSHSLDSHTNRDDRKHLVSLAYTLCCRRSLLPWRVYAFCDSLSQLQERLEAPSLKAVRSRQGRNIVFVFTGQGAQWSGMGRELLYYPTFRASLEDASEYLQHLECSWSLMG